MVTNLIEGSKKKCEQYWPDSGSSTYGPFKVTLAEQQVFADYTIRTMLLTVSSNSMAMCHDTVNMQLEHGGQDKPWRVQQYHYTSWPDHGVPDYATSMLSFHKRVTSQHKTSRGPILVHCRYNTCTINAGCAKDA